jgi:tetratricopeptide (TPR) repeat protein
MRTAVALAIVMTLGRIAATDPETDADAAFRAAQARATAGDATAIDALEAIGRGPPTRWTDDAWAAAARLAERAGNFARARADLAQVMTTADDDITRRRAQTALARLAATTGDRGQWDAVVVRHDALEAEIMGGTGDPKPAIGELEALVGAHPDYPGATAARLVIAQGWQRDGEAARGIAVLDEAIAAAPSDELRGRARYAAFHARIHASDLAGARADLDAIAASPGADPFVVQQLEHDLAVATLRARLRFGLWSFLAALAALAIGLARRDAGSWRGAARALVRPPVEVWYLAPVMLGLALIAQAGNPMVARAVRAIAVCGVAGAWLSGVSLGLARTRRPLRARRVVPHLAAMLVAGLGVVFLIVDRDRMIDLLLETWRSGPALP